MSKADKMFEKLGYEKDLIITYTFKQTKITFYCEYEDYCIEEIYLDNEQINSKIISFDDISSEVAEAIKKKMEELGWK